MSRRDCVNNLLEPPRCDGLGTDPDSPEPSDTHLHACDAALLPGSSSRPRPFAFSTSERGQNFSPIAPSGSA
jgi:hypothetical protein